jgi:hypothetical protein
MTFSVIDPCNRTGKINIPGCYMSETKGVTDFIECGGNPPPGTKDLSLCLLFQKGRCHAGSRCNQVHASVEFINSVRSASLAGKTCCARHGDLHSTSIDEARTVIVTGEDGDRQFQLRDFGFTASLEVALKRARGPVRVQGTRLCRLHLRGGCKFGRDCKNVHLCSLATPLEAPAAVSKPAPVPAPLGTGFRALDISNRCESVNTSRIEADASFNDASSIASRSVSEHSADWGVKPLSVLSLTGLEAFQGMRAESDPLDLDEAANECSLTAKDLAAFVDALVEYEPAAMSSPQWLVA